jgi:dienelactone hydrolase
MRRATVLAIALILSALLCRGAVAAMPPPVSVDIPLPPQSNAALPNPEGGNLRGFLYRPEQPRTGNPALVLLHDCFGLQDYQRTWAQMLAELGYVVLLIDSFGPRGLSTTCDTDVIAGDGLAGGAQAARDYLAVLPSADQERTGLPAVDPDRIALIAWGAGAMRSLATATPFTAAVAFYPDCRQLPEDPVDTPLLILAGAEDDWAPPEWCIPLVERNVAAGLEHRIWIYPKAFYGFDNPTNRTRTFLKSIFNSRGQGSRGANVGYSARP